MNTNKRPLIAPTDLGLITIATHWGLVPALLVITGIAAAALAVHVFTTSNQEGLF